LGVFPAPRRPHRDGAPVAGKVPIVPVIALAQDELAQDELTAVSDSARSDCCTGRWG